MEAAKYLHGFFTV